MVTKYNTVPSVSFATLLKRVGITTPYSRIKQELGGYFLAFKLVLAVSPLPLFLLSVGGTAFPKEPSLKGYFNIP